MARTRRSGGGFGKVLLGFLLGVLALGGGAFAYLKLWKPRTQKPRSQTAAWSSAPKKRSGAPFIMPPGHEAREPRKPPFGIGEDVFEAGAHVYMGRCAGCHGTPGHPAAVGAGNQSPAVQFWSRSSRSQAPGEIFEKVAGGVRASGMPAYKGMLSENAMWQVSLLLAEAGKPLPDPVTRILSRREATSGLVSEGIPQIR